jgi:hypothetical protein
MRHFLPPSFSQGRTAVRPYLHTEYSRCSSVICQWCIGEFFVTVLSSL